MELLYKPDWQQARKHYLAWWAHECLSRCCLAVTATRRDAPDLPAPPAPDSIRQKWYDLDLISRQRQYEMARTFFGGEALPVWHGGYPGHTAIPTFLGCRVELDWETGWWQPILTAEELDAASLRMDTGCPDYTFALQLLRRGVREARGKSLVSVGAFGGGGDTLAALRGAEQLLIDCVERPEQVRRAELFLMDVFGEYYETAYRITREANDGAVCWFGIWAPGRHYCAQNDFSYMISPRMFRELFLEAIERQTRFLDYTIYHVDGVGAFRHLDALCELPRLQAIQILPGAGKPSPLHYMDVLKKVQRAGKNLHISIPPEELPDALAELSARGLFISTSCRDEDHARQLLRDAERLSRDRAV